MSLLVYRKELQVVASTNGADWEGNTKLWVVYDTLGLWLSSL